MNKLRGLILLTSSYAAESCVSSIVIARWLRNMLKLPVFTWNGRQDPSVAACRVFEYGSDEEAYQISHRKPAPQSDYIIMVNQSTTFSQSDFLAWTAKLVHNTKKLIFVQNDYKLPMHSRYKRAAEAGKVPMIYWSAIQRVVVAKGGALLDWNRLTYAPVPMPRRGAPTSIFYFGAYRKDRGPLFEKYFGRNSACRAIISAPSGVQQKKFAAMAGPSVTVRHDKRPIAQQLVDVAATLYLEDPYSSRNYTSPANRFYEALSAGTALLIDEAALSTFNTAGLHDASLFAVSSSCDVMRLLPRAREIAKTQRKLWTRDYCKELRADVLRQAKILKLK